MLFVAIVSTCVVSKVLIVGRIVRECEDLFYLGLDLVCPCSNDYVQLHPTAPLLAKRDVRPRPDWISGLALEGFPSLPFLFILSRAIDSIIKSFSLLVLVQDQDQDQVPRARPNLFDFAD